MNIVSLSQKKKRVEISDFELDHPIVFEYFNNLPAAERDDKLLKAIYIGVLALIEDRISAFFARTSNELGTELESLKILFDLKQEVFFKSAVKGIEAEEEISQYLKAYCKDNKLSDEIVLTGNSEGIIPKNKTGDIVSYLDGNEQTKIIIECKFDKSIRLGDIKSKDVFTNKADTAWSQLIEAQANREGQVSIIVLDASGVDNSISSYIENVRYIPSIGFVAIVDSQKGDYTNLAIAYMLSRDIAIKAQPVELDKDLLTVIVNRIIKDIDDLCSVKKLVMNNIQNNQKILAQLEKSLLLAEFNQKFLQQFLSTGTLTKKELLDFYFGDEIKDKYKSIEKEIKNL
ncbi:hypothetical protein [Kordiimonas laminariae]|uniref:hypothetical protein n=1 Tax=Kordiimonas laminariae TaxID=2917717 RepID=UPI001FF5F0DE|nr:hypothetical protein [Kordiimonas laminariae]MCK0070853.1 hypothetical protein [Kordiimonas laminariae]